MRASDAQPIDLDARGRAYGTTDAAELGAGLGTMIDGDGRMIGASLWGGWFIRDAIELSALLGISNVEVDNDDATLVTAIIEPSYHLPLTPAAHAFAGLGVGAVIFDELGTGLTATPRIGAKLRVGARGLVTPSVSYQYVFNNIEEPGEMQGAAVNAALDALRLDVGYAMFW